MKTVLILLVLILSGCGTTDKATRQLKKAERHIAKAIALGADVKADTITITKQVITPEYKTDTVVKVKNFRDTVRIENNRIAWKVKVDTITKKLYVQATVKPDTVYVDVPVAVHTNIKAGYTLWDLIILAFVAFFTGVLLSPLVKKGLKLLA